MLFFKITLANPQYAQMKIAAKAINDGKLVAFPTETVYGLGADVFNIKAVSKIFKIKKRPLKDPLIVHIPDWKTIFDLAEDISEVTIKLVKKFWPGPLTVVLKKSAAINDKVTGGLNTVAIRMPNNLIALNLIKLAKTPIAAPSANMFGRISPTCASHVLDDFSDKIDVVIDGGKCKVGIESTVLDMTGKTPTILRPGGITKEALSRTIKSVKLYNKKNDIILSPGMMKSHYAPYARLILVKKQKNQTEKIKNLVLKFEKKGKFIGVMTVKEDLKKFNGLNVKAIGAKDNLKECASNLFSVLRDFDKEKVDIIIACLSEQYGIGLAIADRLQKAASEQI